MSILSILEFPDSRLRTIAKPVVQVDKKVSQFVDDLFETMYAEQGVGLAATQVDVHQCIIVLDISEEKNEKICLINPEFIEKVGEKASEEGCLSVPSFFEPINRAEKITIKALDQKGQSFELEAVGLLAVCIQHEMDHLLGKLFVDYLSPLKRGRIKKKMLKLHKREK